jgi:hypothetical protein
MEKSERKRPLGKPGRRWNYKLRMDLREIGYGVEWIQLAQDRGQLHAAVNTIMNVRILAPWS